MKLSERIERASRLYGKGMVAGAAGLLAYIASAAIAFGLAAVLQLAFGWSNERTESAFWVLTVLCFPLPLGALLSSYPARTTLAADEGPSRNAMG